MMAIDIHLILDISGFYRMLRPSLRFEFFSFLTLIFSLFYTIFHPGNLYNRSMYDLGESH